jgi:hypothetical protein
VICQPTRLRPLTLARSFLGPLFRISMGVARGRAVPTNGPKVLRRLEDVSTVLAYSTKYPDIRNTLVLCLIFKGLLYVLQ